MAGAVDAEILVAAEVVGEEADADVERDELAGKGQEPFLGGVEERARGGPIPGGQGLEHGHLHLDLGEVALVFEGGAGGGADHVAKIVEGQAGHDGVQVDHAHGLAAFGVEHDVVELGVVVGDAFGDLAAGVGVKQDVHDRFVVEGELDLGPGALDAAAMVVLDGLLEGGEAFAGVMEIGDGFDQAAREVGNQVLEPPEGLARLGGLAGGLDGFKGLGALDEEEAAPDVAAAVAVVGPAVAGGDDREHAPGDLRDAGQFLADVSGDAHDVVHHGVRILEHALVDLLVDVTDAHPGLVVGGGVGLVDMPDLARLSMEDLAVDLEVFRDFQQFLFVVNRHGGACVQVRAPARARRGARSVPETVHNAVRNRGLTIKKATAADARRRGPAWPASVKGAWVAGSSASGPPPRSLSASQMPSSLMLEFTNPDNPRRGRPGRQPV